MTDATEKPSMIEHSVEILVLIGLVSSVGLNCDSSLVTLATSFLVDWVCWHREM